MNQPTDRCDLSAVHPFWQCCRAPHVESHHRSPGILDLEKIEENLFRGTQPAGRLAARFRRPGHRPGAGRGATHGRRRRPHSLHAYFLLGGDPKVPIVYRGRAFARRPQLRDPALHGDPARPVDFHAGRLVPQSGTGGAGSRLRAARRAAARGPAGRERILRALRRAHARAGAALFPARAPDRNAPRRPRPLYFAQRKAQTPCKKSGCGPRPLCRTIPRFTARRSPICPT